jgi:hypothetical protein
VPFQNAKLSLEQRPIRPEDENYTKLEELNNPNSHLFVRYYSAKRQTDKTMIYRDGHFGGAFEVYQLH